MMKNIKVWTVTLYRNNSETPVIYEKVKHYWWDNDKLKIAIYDNPPEHYYVTWPQEHISHIIARRDKW